MNAPLRGVWIVLLLCMLLTCVGSRATTINVDESTTGLTLDQVAARGQLAVEAKINVTSLQGATTWVASSDASWLELTQSSKQTPGVLTVRFNTGSLGARWGFQSPSYAATVKIKIGSQTIAVPVSLLVENWETTKLKSRAGTTKVYAISSGYQNTRLCEIDTLEKCVTRTMTVSGAASDFFIHEADGRIYIMGQTISAIDLESFALVRSYPTTSGNSTFTGLSAGEQGVLVGWSSGSKSIVTLNTASGQITDRLSIPALTGAYDAGRKRFYAEIADGRGLCAINADGGSFTIERASYIQRGLTESPVFLSENGETVAWSGKVFDGDLHPKWALGLKVYALSGDGRYAFCEGRPSNYVAIYDVADRRFVDRVPGSTNTAAFNSATGTLVFKESQSLDLTYYRMEAGNHAAYLGSSPASGEAILPRDRLSWNAVDGALAYRVYLGNDENAVANAETGSPEYLGEVKTSEFVRANLLAATGTWHWRVDVVRAGRVIRGGVQSFRVGTTVPGLSHLEASPLALAPPGELEIPVLSEAGGIAWRAETSSPWIKVLNESGTGAGEIRLQLDPTRLPPLFDQYSTNPLGFRKGEITVTTSESVYRVSLKVLFQTLEPNLFRSDRHAARVVGVSSPYVSDGQGPGAWLIEIDANTGRVTRAKSICGAASDLVLHERDGAIYISSSGLNWLGRYDAATFELQREYAPLQAQDGGYANLMAGGANRLVVQTAERSVLLDTATGEVLTSMSKNGPGSMMPDGNTYLELGSARFWLTDPRSGVSYEETGGKFKVYDLSADTFALRTTVTFMDVPTKPYGNRLVLTEDGGRVFWFGAYYETETFQRQGVLVIDWARSLNGVAVAATQDGSQYFDSGSVIETASGTVVGELPRWGSGRVVAYNSVAGNWVLGSSGWTAALSSEVAKSAELSASNVRPNGVTIAWRKHNVSRKSTLEFRAVGSASWSSMEFYEDNAAGGSRDFSNLTPQTAYEFRFREQTKAGTPWVYLTVNTPPAAPVFELPKAVVARNGSALMFQLPQGNGWTYQVTGLPPGVTYDPSTRQISGKPAETGRYSISVTASADGSSSTASMDLLFMNGDARQASERYAGLLTSNIGLVGAWDISRKGLTFSGKLRTNSGSMAFKGLFAESNGYLASRSWSKLDGVSCRVDAVWDEVEEQIALSVTVVDFLYSDTPDWTGFVVPWSKTSPLAAAGSFTAVTSSFQDGTPNRALIPHGRGYLAIAIDATGAVKASGMDALGHKITATGTVAGDGLIPFLSSGSGQVNWGALLLDDPFTHGSRIGGVLAWTAFLRTSTGPLAYPKSLRVVGAPYNPVVAQAAFMTAGADNLVRFGGGPLSFGWQGEQGFSSDGKKFLMPKAGTADNPWKLAFSFAPKTGIFSGSLVLTGADAQPVTVKLNGAVVTDLDGEGTVYGGGFFLMPDAQKVKRSGWVDFIERGEPFFPEAVPED